MTEKQSKTPPQLADELARATRALTRAGFTLVEGAQEWKPPIGPSASPLLDRIDLLMTLLSDGCDINKALGFIIDRSDNEGKAEALSILSEHLDKCEAALAGKLPERRDTEWTDAASTPTAADYRELQAQHDQLQSKYKAALDMLREMLGFVDGPKWQALIDERKAHDWLGRIEALLAGQVPALSPHQSLLDWAVTSWHEQVAHRPMENVYRRTLDSVWRQVIRFAGEDPQSIIGPSHDDLLHAAAPKPEGAA